MDVKIPDRSKPQRDLSGVLVFGHRHKDVVEFTVAGVCVCQRVTFYWIRKQNRARNSKQDWKQE